MLLSHLGKRPRVAESLSNKFSLIDEPWRPKVVGALNGQEVKLVRSIRGYIGSPTIPSDLVFAPIPCDPEIARLTAE